MATAEATQTQETSSNNSTRGAKRKESYLEAKNIKSIVTRPQIPAEFDPDVHGNLKESDFDDVLEYYNHKVDLHAYWQNRFKARAEKLATKTPEERKQYAQAENSKDSMVAHFRKLKSSGSDVSELFAALKQELEVAMAD